MQNKTDQNSIVPIKPSVDNDGNGKQVTQAIRTLFMIVAVSGVLIFAAYRDMADIADFIQRSGWIGVGVAIGIYGIMGATLIPTEPLTVFLTTLIGPFKATIIAGLGNLLAATVEYVIGTHIGDATSFEKRKEKLPFGLGKFPADSPIFLIFARMIPGYGSPFISLISGIYRVPWVRYIWATGISTLIGAAFYAYGGFGILHIGK